MIQTISKKEADKFAEKAYSSAGYCKADKVGFIALVEDIIDNESYIETLAAVYKATGGKGDYFVILVVPASGINYLEFTDNLSVAELSEKIMEITEKEASR